MSATKPIRLVFNPKYTGKQKIKFDLGSVDHHLYGKADKLYGEFDLFHSNGSYPQSNYFGLTKDEQEKLRDGVIERLGFLFEHLTEDDLRAMATQAVVGTTLCMPRLDVTTKRFPLAVDLGALAVYIDDTFEDDSVLEDPAYVYKQYMIQIGGDNWKSFLSSPEQRAEKKEAILKVYPDSTLLIKAIEDLNSRLTLEFPDLPITMKPVYHVAFQSLEGNMIAANRKTDSLPSERFMLVSRGRDAGTGLILDAMSYIQRITVGKGVQKTFLFEMLRRYVGEFGGVLNDILGIVKDIEEEGTHKNIILRRVLREGISLDESSTQTVQTLRTIVSDMNFIMDRLLEVFPDEKGLHDYILATKDMCDGQSIGYVYASLYKSRFKPGTIQILPVE